MSPFIQFLSESASLAPAVKIGGIVHKAAPGDIIHAHVVDRHNLYDKLDGPDVVHGFTDHTGRFMNRRQATTFAIKHHIVPSKARKSGGLGSEYLNHYQHR